MLLSDFEFDLPNESIAQQPVSPRDASKLLEVSSCAINDKIVKDLPDLLTEKDVLVFNNTKVIPAKLRGKRGEAHIEVNLHQYIGAGKWKVFAKPAKRLRVSDVFIASEELQARVEHKYESGEVELFFDYPESRFFELLNCYGEMPLPPYIQRKEGAEQTDNERYQTVYAKTNGAVAAPTAGLHFTPALLAALEAKGVNKAFVTLHVGAGTFLPVKVDNIHDHKMHSEYFEMDQDTANLINETREKGGRVIAVGTTSLRVLESVADETGYVSASVGETDIFITPGYRFKVVDMLMTNFHLPKSTLFMLVCAFAGYERMKHAYQHAIEKGYRFFSYGDSSLLYKAE